VNFAASVLHSHTVVSCDSVAADFASFNHGLAEFKGFSHAVKEGVVRVESSLAFIGVL